MKARYIKDGRVVDVRQVSEDRVYFVDRGGNPYKVDELDFNDVPLKSGDATGIGELLGGLVAFDAVNGISDEQRMRREYYRTLRGDLLLAILGNVRDLSIAWGDMGTEQSPALDLRALVDVVDKAVCHLEGLEGGNGL